ncbi:MULTISPECIES: MerR family transcriptional regulator [unclassified Mycobacterium]|uniref:MerR family transcriptional regulator n=1 Tax=unclassified Mycobacterium TaxID=2642494 RepID=UPI00073FDB04|nr:MULTISPECIES: MerR family transcriptional regulator [unclassified Mycobacterium]KUH85790.1 transcriptional regulator [Mycobacterium sp. GA-1999]KUH91647.1 transcriptional regulator [Mycobacterium sp. GA-0227b]KUH96113.1 transcriptional regulator [Mycobacterium sp. IS-1556]
MDAKTVGAVAALTGVSVRTLHHYDHIGLVVPSVRTSAGYRGYTDADIERLHVVLVYRSVGLPLEEIRALLDGDADVLDHLQRQHRLLLEQADRLQHTIKAVEELMSAHRSGIQLTAEEQVEIFGTTAHSQEYAAEAEERWGDTDAWKQSQQRASQFTKQDWIDIKAEGDALLQALAEAKRSGVTPGTAQADALAERHRLSIERFYDCDHEMQVCLAQMYVADERFTRYYDDVEPGLSQFLHDIIVARSDR